MLKLTIREFIMTKREYVNVYITSLQAAEPELWDVLGQKS